MRILVRAGELRCRDDWGSDLWHVREPGDQVLDVSMMDDALNESADSHSARRIPPPTDHIVQPTAFQQRRPSLDPERTSLVSDDLNRELLRKAREQFRERQANIATRSVRRPNPDRTDRYFERGDSAISRDSSRPLRSEVPTRSLSARCRPVSIRATETSGTGMVRAAVAIDDIGPVEFAAGSVSR